MSPAEPNARAPDLPAAIHASGWQAALAITGGGSRAIPMLLETPGASRTVIAAIVPYSAAALADLLGAAPPQACSPEVARALAMKTFHFARERAGEHDPHRLVGVGCTASLATDRPKHGDHRVHVAAQTADATAVWSLVLAKGRRDRAAEELVAAELVVRVVAAAVGVSDPKSLSADLHLADADRLDVDRADADMAVSELLLGARNKVLLTSGVAAPTPTADASFPALVFPGAFNPPHAGHLRMAALAEERLNKTLTWELSIANVDKPLLDFIAIRDRVQALQSEDHNRQITLTRAPAFREKAALFPGATFVVGADTVVRIADPRYYGGDIARRDAAIAAIAGHACRFLVFGRQIGDRFETLSELDLPPALRALCDEVPAAEFREDISSTQIRKASPQSPT